MYTCLSYFPLSSMGLLPKPMIFPPPVVVVLIQVSTEKAVTWDRPRLLYAYWLDPLKPMAVEGPATAAGVCRYEGVPRRKPLSRPAPVSAAKVDVPSS